MCIFAPAKIVFSDQRLNRFYDMNNRLHWIVLPLTLLLTSCEGILDGIYDDPIDDGGTDVEVAGDTISGHLYIEATGWDEWYYVDLHAIRDAVTAAHQGAAMDSSCLTFEPYKVPLTLTGQWDEHSRIVTYRFRVLTGGGLKDNEYVSEVQADTQPEPEAWDFAIHRNNERTHGGMALETSCSTMDELPADSRTLLRQMAAAGQDTAFVSDVYSEKDVWVDQSTMLQELIPCQAIEVNEVLSRWVTMEIPPMPPAYSHDGNVFLLRMSDGTVAALQCSNYLNPAGNTKCCLTIEYRYPY